MVMFRKYGSKVRPEVQYPRQGSWAEKASRALSVMLHPFVVPVWAMAVLMFADPVLAAASVQQKLFLWAMVVIAALIIPALSIALLRTLRIIPDLSIESRQDRTIPLAIVALSYGLCIVMVDNVMYGGIVHKFLIAAFCSAVVALAITPLWKISLHMISAGAVCGMFAVLLIAGFGTVLLPLIAAVLLAGMLASARLYLGKHNPAQVAVGFLIGCTIAAATMMFIR